MISASLLSLTTLNYKRSTCSVVIHRVAVRGPFTPLCFRAVASTLPDESQSLNRSNGTGDAKLFHSVYRV